MTPALLMGAVAYDPKVVTIWEGFRGWLTGRGLDFDFVLYSHYERQVEDLVAGRIDAAWNSPLAWLRAERLAGAAGKRVRALAMRDTDRDLTSVVVVRADSPVQRVEDLAGKVVGTGALDSPQATLIPLAHLRAAGVTPTVRRFDIGVGLHGDHIGGERDAALALVAGEVDAACMIDANHLAFAKEGTLAPDATRILAQTAAFDHCNLTVVDGQAEEAVALFWTLLASMSYADAEVRPLLDLEGLTAWEEGRTTGYAALDEAVTAT
ncbi:phosphate/phosphite/phosphonate ABC transporter substrate-binding protein, partial [Actinophytocola sp.]|uniref:phosphate/phosphite/phosphonate ABC transporter substrate-binding protein n=1 Tax=Actinophytocola sp. TaxID=1872138 RepID=UPI002ED7D3EB